MTCSGGNLCTWDAGGNIISVGSTQYVQASGVYYAQQSTPTIHLTPAPTTPMWEWGLFLIMAAIAIAIVAGVIEVRHKNRNP